MSKKIYGRLGGISFVLMVVGIISGVWGLRFGYEIAWIGFGQFGVFLFFYYGREAEEKKRNEEGKEM